MREEKSFNVLPFGLMELDTAGMVKQYTPDGENRETSTQPLNLVGCNLFTDVAPIAGMKEFRERFQVFLQSPLPTEVFNLNFNDSRESIHARVMLAQRHEQRRTGSVRSVLVHLVKA
jgi:photoactive yellow protein